MSLSESVNGFVAPPRSKDLLFLQGGGEMGDRIRAYDWTKTPLGPPATWPQSLMTCLRVMLTSRQPMFVWWGEDLINLYNDAYKTIVGGKHPQALGEPASKVWREIWDEAGPRARSALHRNEGTYDEALQLIMERNGYEEETYYTFSYSPVPNDDGTTGGILCANTDETLRIIGERRLALLRDLAARTWEAQTACEAFTLSAECLGGNPRDIPFGLIYAFDEESQIATLAGACGIDQMHKAAPITIALNETTSWPIAQCVRHRVAVVLRDLDTRFGTLPSGAWDRPPAQAVILPIAAQGRGGVAGVLVAGCNPYRPYDDSYQGFLTLVANQIGAAVINTRAYEEEVKRTQALSDLDQARGEFAETLQAQAEVLQAELARRRGIETHQKLLLDELNHRVKNTLATVQAVAMQTLRSKDTSHRDTFIARLFALSTQHDLLTLDNWEGANLDDVVLRALRPYEEQPSGRCKVEGPHVRLTPKRALALGMAFHELATNAAKHGALSIEGGSVEVSWQVDPQTRGLKLRWQEAGGPRVAVPRYKGFGTRLIERGLSHELSAQVCLLFRPGGVICTWEMSLQAQ